MTTTTPVAAPAIGEFVLIACEVRAGVEDPWQDGNTYLGIVADHDSDDPNEQCVTLSPCWRYEPPMEYGPRTRPTRHDRYGVSYGDEGRFRRSTLIDLSDEDTRGWYDDAVSGVEQWINDEARAIEEARYALADREREQNAVDDALARALGL